MHLFSLVCGIVFFPQAYTLTCNKCRFTTGSCAGTEEQCPADSTHCTTARLFIYTGNTKDFDRTEGSCSKAEYCKDGSFNGGVRQSFITTKCCDTDKCNTDQPNVPNLKPSPNGKKCYRCDGKGDCTGTLNCDGEQTHCATAEDEGGVVKGCATKSMCANPPHSGLKLKCCEGDYCNGSTSTRASLLLLTTMLFSLFYCSN